MTDGDDETPDESAGADENADVPAESLSQRLDDAAEALDAAETEADLDEVEATLDDIESDLEATDFPEPEEEEEESPQEELESRLSDLRDDLESQRGPYAEDVVSDVEAAQGTLTDTRWTDQGEDEIAEAVNAFLESAGDALGTDFGTVSGDVEALASGLDAVIETIQDADLDADEDAETIAALVEAADGLTTGLDDSQEWDDLEVNQKLLAQGFYDVLGHYKDFPPEWSALKEHEKQGNTDMILLALDMLDSDFMERHCLEALERMGDEAAFETMHERAQRRDQPAIRILGKIGSDEAVETLLEYVDEDSNPQLQKVVFKALGEIGSQEATQPLANKLVMDNEHVRTYAARALGLIGDTRAISPLTETLADDDVDSVRASAAWALRQIGTETALEAAAEYADDTSYIVQAEAERAADALGEEATV